MEYLKRVLGIEVLYENKALEHLPNFISTRYDSQKVSLNGQKAVFLYPKTELEQVETLKKHLEPKQIRRRGRQRQPAVPKRKIRSGCHVFIYRWNIIR